MHKTIDNIVNDINNTKVYEVLTPTKLELATTLSSRFDNNIYLKREDETQIHAFKLRGAYQKISSLSQAELSRGIITSSAGNHAQGVAYSAKKLGVKAKVVMTQNTPQIKIDAVKNLGAEVILYGDIFNDAHDYAIKLADEQNLVYIPPYDDAGVIAGQGTIGKEIIEQLKTANVVFIPVGGGGLISGIACYLKTKYPDIKIIAIESQDTPTLEQALKHNKRVILEEVGTFADGTAVKQIGKLPFEILSQGLVDECILVNNDEICAGVKDIYNDTRAIAEPSGALAVAGVKKYIEQHNIKNQNLVAIISGGNVNFDRLRYIAERAEIGEGFEAIFAAIIAEKPGSFLKFLQKLRGHNITEFNYRFNNEKEAHIFVGAEIFDTSEKQRLFKDLNKDFPVQDLSDNSIAKTHIRYMVGGRASAKSEVIYRFEFPERKGALLKFLTEISGKWNISLFHYRNHGSSYGRVLVGFQAEDISELEKSLAKIGYIFHNETDNIAYKYFL
jgi:threonine dehydratase